MLLAQRHGSGTFTFSRGDTLKGTIRTVKPTGSSTPLYWTVDIPSYEIGLTNGSNLVYAMASGWEELGGSTDPHQTFDLDVAGPDLDFALQQTPGISIPAVLEIHVSGFAGRRRISLRTGSIHHS